MVMLMIQRCSFCNCYEEIVCNDYAPPQQYARALYIAICWRCAILFDLGFDEVRKRIAELFPKMLLCSTCQEKFIPAKQGHNICRACYLKNKPQNQQVWEFE